MKCSNCAKPLDPGSAFCGSCGLPFSQQHLGQTAIARTFDQTQSREPDSHYPNQLATAGQGNTNAIPAYVLAARMQHNDSRATIGLVCAVFGLVGALFWAVIGIVLGIAAFVLITLSWRQANSAIKMSGVVSERFIIGGLGAHC